MRFVEALQIILIYLAFENATGNGGVITQTAKLVPNDGTAYDNFGYSVAISGDTAVVGAYLDDVKGSASGSAYVFVLNGTGWAQVTK
ncbi:hypothetical protein ACHAXS_000493, partial [Conticribra weissflogii]